MTLLRKVRPILAEAVPVRVSVCVRVPVVVSRLGDWRRFSPPARGGDPVEGAGRSGKLSLGLFHLKLVDRDARVALQRALDRRIERERLLDRLLGGTGAIHQERRPHGP